MCRMSVLVSFPVSVIKILLLKQLHRVFLAHSSRYDGMTEKGQVWQQLVTLHSHLQAAGVRHPGTTHMGKASLSIYAIRTIPCRLAQKPICQLTLDFINLTILIITTHSRIFKTNC